MDELKQFVFDFKQYYPFKKRDLKFLRSYHQLTAFDMQSMLHLIREALSGIIGIEKQAIRMREKEMYGEDLDKILAWFYSYEIKKVIKRTEVDLTKGTFMSKSNLTVKFQKFCDELIERGMIMNGSRQKPFRNLIQRYSVKEITKAIRHCKKMAGIKWEDVSVEKREEMMEKYLAEKAETL